MALGNKGQAVAMDIILVCICVSIFAVAIWTASMGGKAPSSQALRARQDYVKSMHLTALFTTPDSSDLRYAGKSVSDLLSMHLSNPEGMPIEVVIAKMKEAKIGETLREKAIGAEAEWFIYADSDASYTSQGLKVICLQGKSGSDAVEVCPQNIKVPAEISTAASALVVFPISGTGAQGGKAFISTPIFLGVKWS